MNDEEQAYRQARAEARAIRDFYGHLAIFVIVNIGLFIIDMLTDGGPWFYWSLLGWGIGIAVHAVSVFAPWRDQSRQWEERKAQQILERRREGRK